jgi:rRNA maturation RNase YbeY
VAVNIFYENVDYKLKQVTKVKSWIKEIVTSHKGTTKIISIIFCSDDYLLQINRQYLNHDYYTDIITFPYEEFPMVGGDIFISIDTVMSNAQQFNVSLSNEVMRVVSHGILHLIGFNDYTDQERANMHSLEDSALKLFEANHGPIV